MQVYAYWFIGNRIANPILNDLMQFPILTLKFRNFKIQIKLTQEMMECMQRPCHYKPGHALATGLTTRSQVNSRLQCCFSHDFNIDVSEANLWSFCIVPGDVEKTGRSASVDHRPLSVRAGYSDRNRLQSADERVESDHTGHPTIGRRRLSVSDQHEERARLVRHSAQRAQ